jgi:hypothetical protein
MPVAPGTSSRSWIRPHDAARKRQDDIPHAAHCDRRALGGGERRDRVAGEDEEIAAADTLRETDPLLAHELAVHHRDAPVPPAVDQLGDLEAVAEVAQAAAESEPVLGRIGGDPLSAAQGSTLSGAPLDLLLRPWSTSRRAGPQPGRPSGVSRGEVALMAASQPQAITDVANPVAVTAACRAQALRAAVMTSRVARMPNASANVSSIATPSMCIIWGDTRG